MTGQDREIRSEYPIFEKRKTHYIDNAATTQKPRCVIAAEAKYYEERNSNPFRGLYGLSVAATESYEGAREAVREFIGAEDTSEIIFTRNASEGLNLVAYSFGMHCLQPGDEIIVSIAEHHSNMLPWQMVAKEKGVALTYFECEPDGSFSLEKFKNLLHSHTKLVAMTQLSNLFGRAYDIKAFAAAAHEVGAVFVCDGAQSVPHMRVDVSELDVDFLAFSGHKMYAPMGIGVLYGKQKLLEKMPPFLYGGEMIDSVSRDGAKFAELPHKFEAGTVNVGGAVGLHAAIDYMKRIGWETIERRENELTERAFLAMEKLPHIRVIGSDEPLEHHGILTFTVDGVHPHDVSAIFDEADIAVRAGHHCAQPLHKHLGLFSTTRASFAFYNTTEDVDAFIDILSGIRERMGYV